MGRVLLFHLSDLHMGSHHLGSKSWHASLFGHKFTLLTQLKVALQEAVTDQAVTSDDSLVYVVGGDLTRVGGDYDSDIAFTYLLSELVWLDDCDPNPPERRGLSLPRTHFYTIPGNHDHWDGYRT